MMLSNAVELLVDDQKILDRSNSTISQYNKYLNEFNDYLCSQYNRQLYVDDVKPEDIKRFIFINYGEDKYSTATRHNIITSFKSL